MRGRASSFPWLWMLLALVVVALEVWHQNRWLNGGEALRAGQFITLREPRLVDELGNDGDSFLMAHEGGQRVLRLYFVDCPEKSRYKLVETRLRDQATYFGISLAATLRIGQQAREFSESLLRGERYTVKTRMEGVYDSGRVYALIVFEDGETLAEKLVKAGLCRIYTRGTDLPDGRTEMEFRRHLRRLESEAREQRRGAWGEVRSAG